MPSITLSARFISATIGLSVCYAISYYLFWDSQFRLTGFHIDPQNSLFRTLLDNIIAKDTAKVIAVICAFISIHLSWAWRFKAGFAVERLLINTCLKNHKPALPNKSSK